MLLGCASLHDLLKPAAVLCKVLQQDVCVAEAIQTILKTGKATFDGLLTVKMASSRMVQNADGSTTYVSGSRPYQT